MEVDTGDLSLLSINGFSMDILLKAIHNPTAIAAFALQLFGGSHPTRYLRARQLEIIGRSQNFNYRKAVDRIAVERKR